MTRKHFYAKRVFFYAEKKARESRARQTLLQDCNFPEETY